MIYSYLLTIFWCVCVKERAAFRVNSSALDLPIHSFHFLTPPVEFYFNVYLFFIPKELHFENLSKDNKCTSFKPFYLVLFFFFFSKLFLELLNFLLVNFVAF
jgi:hypothetical protein